MAKSGRSEARARENRAPCPAALSGCVPCRAALPTARLTGRRACAPRPSRALALRAPLPTTAQPTIEGGPAARVCTGSQSTCLKALLAEQRRQPVLSADALFLAFDRAAAAAAATDAPTTDAPTADARHVDLICPEHTLFWRVVAAKRSPPTSALVRAALGSAVLGRAWRGASNATGGAGGRQIRPPPSSQLDVVQLARPPTDGGYGNVDAVAALIAQAAAGARVRFRRVRSLAFSADGWPMVRQAEALSTAAVFVAPHGAGLTHLNWMPPGGCVVEVFPECVYDPSYTHWAAGARRRLAQCAARRGGATAREHARCTPRCSSARWPAHGRCARARDPFGAPSIASTHRGTPAANAAARGDVHYFGILNGTQATRPMARWKHAFHKFRASPLCSGARAREHTRPSAHVRSAHGANDAVPCAEPHERPAPHARSLRHPPTARPSPPLRARSAVARHARSAQTVWRVQAAQPAHVLARLPHGAAGRAPARAARGSRALLRAARARRGERTCHWQRALIARHPAARAGAAAKRHATVEGEGAGAAAGRLKAQSQAVGARRAATTTCSLARAKRATNAQR